MHINDILKVARTSKQDNLMSIDNSTNLKCFTY